MYWKAIIRRDNDATYTLPAPGQPVTVTINDDQGNMVVQRRQVLNPLGAVDGSLELGPDAATGYYYVNVRLNEEVGLRRGLPGGRVSQAGVRGQRADRQAGVRAGRPDPASPRKRATSSAARSRTPR